MTPKAFGLTFNQFILLLFLLVLGIGYLFSNKDEEPIATQSLDEMQKEEVTTSPEPITSPSPEPLPFASPLDLFGKDMKSLAKRFQIPLNSVGTLVVENPDYDLTIESKNGVTATFVMVSLKQLGACVQNTDSLDNVNQESIDKSEEILNTAGIPIDQLTKKWEAPLTGSVVYKLADKEVSTGCMYDGGSYTVAVKYPLQIP